MDIRRWLGPKARLGAAVGVCLIAGIVLLAATRRLHTSRVSPSGVRVRAAALRIPALQLAPVIRNGNIAEIRGTTECGASVMINGEPALVIFDNCGFKHFIMVPEGPWMATVTAQEPSGGVNTQQIEIPAGNQ